MDRMIYCTNCGSKVYENQSNCHYCGYSLRTNQMSQYGQHRSDDTGGFGWGLLGFCIPIVGLILYLVWKDEKPRTARSAGIGALSRVIILVVIFIFYIIIFIILGISSSIPQQFINPVVSFKLW